MTKNYILVEDYNDDCIEFVTNCTSEELENIVCKIVENDDDGIRKTIDEVCNELYPSKILMTIGSGSYFDYIDCIDNVFSVCCRYMSIFEVVG